MKRPTLRPAWSLSVLTAALTAALAAALAALLLGACSPVDAARSEQAAHASAQDWQSVAAAGTLVVGIAVDYPPFEFYDPNFQIDGFDPAVMRAIGQELGLEIQFVDLAFDGLGQALALGQVDAVISAFSETPERAASLDFS
ncbi:MAG: transporter substrate-binding domain-containing protein, partial [Caldilinea sp.]